MRPLALALLDPQYIVRLIGQMVTVSMETVRLADALAKVRLVEGDVAGATSPGA